MFRFANIVCRFNSHSVYFLFVNKFARSSDIIETVSYLRERLQLQIVENRRNSTFNRRQFTICLRFSTICNSTIWFYDFNCILRFDPTIWFYDLIFYTIWFYDFNFILRFDCTIWFYDLILRFDSKIWFFIRFDSTISISFYDLILRFQYRSTILTISLCDLVLPFDYTNTRHQYHLSRGVLGITVKQILLQSKEVWPTFLGCSILVWILMSTGKQKHSQRLFWTLCPILYQTKLRK